MRIQIALLLAEKLNSRDAFTPRRLQASVVKMNGQNKEVCVINVHLPGGTFDEANVFLPKPELNEKIYITNHGMTVPIGAMKNIKEYIEKVHQFESEEKIRFSADNFKDFTNKASGDDVRKMFTVQGIQPDQITDIEGMNETDLESRYGDTNIPEEISGGTEPSIYHKAIYRMKCSALEEAINKAVGKNVIIRRFQFRFQDIRKSISHNKGCKTHCQSIRGPIFTRTKTKH